MKRGREEDVDGKGPSTSDGNRVLRHELGLVGGLMKSKWARWHTHRLPVNGLVLTPAPGMQWAVLRPTRGFEVPLRDQVRASISGYRGDRASVETVSLGKGGEKRVVMVVAADDGEESSFARLSAAEETAIVVAKISKHTNEPWAAWLDENGDAALAALAEEPLATALSTWRRLRQTESSDPIPFYVNRSKKTLDKASAFCGKLASRLTQLSRGSIAAKLDGWQLEILCRVQMPQDELHVCLKLSDRPEVVAAAKSQSSRSAEIAEDALLSIGPSVGGCLAHLAIASDRNSEGKGTVCVVISKASAKHSVALSAVRATIGEGWRALEVSTEDIVENTTQLKFSHDVNPKIDALVCDTAVDTAEELKKDERFVQKLLSAAAKVLDPGGCVSILVPQFAVDLVIEQLNSKSTADASSDDHDKVWQSHSKYRAHLPSGRSGVKDIPVVLFRIVRGSAK